MDLDYDSCAQFLARLEADSENLNNGINTTANNVKSLGGSPTSVLDTSLSLSPIDNRNSASPPGLSSGSVTSHSPESLRFDYDITWNPNDTAFFSPIDEGILSGQTWDLMSSQGPSSNQQQGQAVTPLSDYIKVENDSSPGPYFGNSQQATISPTQSLIDPATQTALEGTYSFGKEGDSLFDFNNYGGSGSVRQTQGNNPESYSPLTWRNQAQQREDFTSIGWQSPPQAQQVSQQRQQRQPQTPQSQEPASLINSLSPSSSHHTSSSPDSRAHDSHSDDNSAIPRPKKRKTSTDDDAASNGGASAPAPTTGRKQQPKKTAHNMIEKRYRTNLNDKIAALRDSVPSLRVMAGTSKLGEDDDEEDLEGLTPAHKLNKATVLAKATEYIRHLEKRTKRLQDENDQLKNRLAAFEKLATMGGSMGGAGQSGNGSRGGGGGPGGGLMSRLMVGSLAGLMVANGLQEQENGTRQLTAFPTAIMQTFGIPESSTTVGSHLFWLAFRMVLLVSAVIYVIIPSFFDSKTKEKSKTNTINNTALSPVPSLASSVEVRRTAWLTAIQSVWVPRHSFALEIAALAYKTMKLSLRKLIGWNGYALVTGMTEEHEVARIKAWSIALDAQLAGGDATITHSRLILTLLASLTLPATPSRLMLNALHIRVLFWDLGSSFEAFANWLANYYWLEARNVQRKIDIDSAESLPEHLFRLLDLDPNEVLHSKIIQKAYNLAYDRGTGENCEGYDEGMDTVVEDESIRSPLDAVAAWYSSLVLQGVLAANLKTKNPELAQRTIAEDLEAALNVAPPNSKAQLRALVTKAMLEDKDDGTTLRAALKAFEEDIQPHEPASNGVPKIMVSRPHAPAAVTTDIKIAVRCAMALNLLRNSSRAGAIRLFSELDWQRQESGDVKNKLGLLGFVAIWKTLNRFIASDDRWAADAGESVDKAAGMLRVWIGGKNVSKRAGVHRDDCKRVINFCNSMQKRLAGLSDDLDDGYASGGIDAEKKNAGAVAAA
ncbi:hypothetical protein L873DRAFT_1721720 [Choiromyces venosus 120613-1]|uniref:BHLH domain-containing protein n=1 Tax=Choiromyces venosus 120613-1 TaxID=1336337 RepID=A0A3N4IXB8_9PEZI|nr:hypothetical protein L873DRAFT_1721720 [Choiromyces venosus 120613-1]